MSTTEQRHLFPTTESDPSNEYPCLCTFVHRHTHKLWQAKSYIRQTQGFHVEPRVGGGERRADGEEREAGRTKGMKKRETTTRAADRQWRVPLYPRHDSALTTAHPFTIAVTDATHDRSDLIWTYSDPNLYLSAHRIYVYPPPPSSSISLLLSSPSSPFRNAILCLPCTRVAYF